MSKLLASTKTEAKLRDSENKTTAKRFVCIMKNWIASTPLPSIQTSKCTEQPSNKQRKNVQTPKVKSRMVLRIQFAGRNRKFTSTPQFSRNLQKFQSSNLRPMAMVYDFAVCSQLFSSLVWLFSWTWLVESVKRF